MAALLAEDRITAIFEHHTSELSPEKLREFTEKLCNGTLKSSEVFEDGGHGAYIDSVPDKVGTTLVTGPRRQTFLCQRSLEGRGGGVSRRGYDDHGLHRPGQGLETKRGFMEIGRGAEAVITLENGVVKKERHAKSYRQPALDERIRQERTLREARIMSDARRHGVLTPIICDVSRFELKMEMIVGEKLKDIINIELSEMVGETVGKLHQGGIVHGDLTTSNMILTRGKICLIDFGLSFYEKTVEAQGVDVHVYFQTLESTHDQPEELMEAFVAGYTRTYPQAEAVLQRVKEIKARGRYL